MNLTAYFAAPAALWLLLLVLPVAALAWFADRRRERALAALLGPRLPWTAAEWSPRRRRVRRGFALAALAFACLALAQPKWGEGESLQPRPLDLVVCLDVSRSMLARDQEPNRLTAAQLEIRALAARAAGDRLGLVAFAGDATLLLPLTSDLRSFAELVPQAGPLSVARGGTDLAAALDRALAALPQAGGAQAILLLTDGEDHAGAGLRAAARCRERGVVVHCVGFGSPLGSKIAPPGSDGFLRNRSGDEIVTAMDPDSLRRIAAATGGVFVAAATAPQPLLRLYEQQLVPQARETDATQRAQQRANRFQWPLLGSILLWMLAFVVSERRRP